VFYSWDGPLVQYRFKTKAAFTLTPLQVPLAVYGLYYTRVGSVAPSTSGQNVVTTCSRVSTWSRHFERKSIVQCCRRQNTDRGRSFSWKLHAKLVLITREKRGQTFLSQNVRPRSSWVINGKFSCNFHKKSIVPVRVLWRWQHCAIDFRFKMSWPRARHVLASMWSRHFERKSIAQHCRRQRTRAGAIVFSWKLHVNSLQKLCSTKCYCIVLAVLVLTGHTSDKFTLSTHKIAVAIFTFTMLRFCDSLTTLSTCLFI